MNQVFLVGRITKDPECDEKAEGKKLTHITLAVQRPFKNVDGVYDTDFVRCVLWNAVAQSATEYCKTGDVIGVKGRLETQTYEDNEGKIKHFVQVVAERISFIASKKSNIVQESNDNE
jgi:single-strand DNA-binding protein